MVDRAPCRYLTRPAMVLRVDVSAGRETGATMTSDIRLCAWALESDAAVVKMEGVPVWMQREAQGGHLWRKGDCEKCPAYEAV